MSQIEDLLKNNDSPSCEAVQEVQKMLLEPTEELKALDAKIQHLNKYLEELQKKRDKVQEFITRYSVVFSPIRRIPTDLLHKIFQYCLPLHRNPIMAETEAPVLLTRICSLWRSIVLCSPPLWARLHIVFSDQDLLPDDDKPILGRNATKVPKLPKTLVTHILRRRCEAVDEWLHRSGICPLSISVFYTSHLLWPSDVNSNISPGSSETTIQLLGILSSTSNRWQHVEFNMPYEVYNVFEDQFRDSDLGMLTTLRVSFVQPPPFATIKIPKARNLKRIMFNLRLPDIGGFVANWKLTYISLHVALPVSDTVRLLRNCPELVQFKVIISESMIDPNQVPESLFLEDTIFLPRLRVLDIVDYVFCEYAGNFYDRIDAPELVWVAFSTHSSYRAHGDITAASIATLLNKSTKLKKFAIDAIRFTTEAMRQIFLSAGNIMHLLLGREVRTETGSLNRHFMSLAYSWMWSFRDLLVDGIAIQHTTNKTRTTDTPLLPHLEILEISTGGTVSVSDDTLLTFIILRMDPSTSSGLSQLKHVGIIFDRPEVRSIAEGVRQHAQLIGTTSKIKLDLNYPVVSQKQNQPTYAGYALSGIYGRSQTWMYIEIDEEVSQIPTIPTERITINPLVYSRSQVDELAQITNVG
ncbi:hypothetical protein CVT25_001753 [Psilocybe cyanescens]|uniref:F-box domain-containing protein n=1 Tax=Psilocybe cyanescens TaxID=93625 RepID=A0A409WPR4_PSICY|nr:hypothetical protein CVT25_001753 [Psilocybe cyanescens]